MSSAIVDAGLPASTIAVITAPRFGPTGALPAARSSSGRLRSECMMLVLTKPGHTTDTPMPLWPARSSSLARHSEIATTACLVAVYGASHGVEVRPAIDAVLTTWPSSPLATSAGRNARIPWITPHRLTSSVHRQSASDRVQIGPVPPPTPAL